MQFTKTTHKCIIISYTEEHGWYIKFLLVFYGHFQFILPPLISTVPSPVLHTHYLPDLPPKLGHLFAFNAKINTLMIYDKHLLTSHRINRYFWDPTDFLSKCCKLRKLFLTCGRYTIDATK